MSRHCMILAFLAALLGPGSAGEGISIGSPIRSFSNVDCNLFPKNAPTLRLHNRFRVALEWEKVGQFGYPIKATPSSGFFSSFLQGSLDVAVKVYDASGPPYNAFWVFEAGLTDARYRIWVKDETTPKCQAYVRNGLSSSVDHETFASQGTSLANSAIPLVADFSIDPAEPGVREEVKFFDRSEGNPDEWCWRFGDEAANAQPCTDNSAEPTHTYQKTGTFKVTLTVSRDDGPSVTRATAPPRVVTVVRCNFVLKGQKEFSSDEQLGSVTVEASSRGCAWTVANHNRDVIEVTTPTLPSRRGPGKVEFTVLRNETGQGRSGVLVINEGLSSERRWPIEQLANPRACCRPNGTTLCLLNGRFEVRVTFPQKKADPYGRAVRRRVGNEQDGYFWVFDSINVELVVKMLEETPGHYSFFYAGVTDRDFDLSVRDTTTGKIKVYQSRGGLLISRRDTESFFDSSVNRTCG